MKASEKGLAYCFKFFIGPIVAFGSTAAGHPLTMPELDFSEMAPLLFGMLGIGAMRSYEKVKGVA